MQRIRVRRSTVILSAAFAACLGLLTWLGQIGHAVPAIRFTPPRHHAAAPAAAGSVPAKVTISRLSPLAWAARHGLSAACSGPALWLAPRAIWDCRNGQWAEYLHLARANRPGPGSGSPLEPGPGPRS